MSEWQPIETAPKYQDAIDIWGKGGRYTNCDWGITTYGREAGWVYQSGYDSNGPVIELVPDPTHWMPLPSRPAAQEPVRNGLSLRDWEPLIRKATTRAQIAAIFDALDTCFTEDRTIIKDCEWPRLTRLISDARSRDSAAAQPAQEGSHE